VSLEVWLGHYISFFVFLPIGTSDFGRWLSKLVRGL
jgi:predicted small integral membrane protein